MTGRSNGHPELGAHRESTPRAQHTDPALCHTRRHSRTEGHGRHTNRRQASDPSGAAAHTAVPVAEKPQLVAERGTGQTET